MDVAEAATERIAWHDAVADLVRDDHGTSGSGGEKLTQSFGFALDLSICDVGHDLVGDPERQAIEKDCPIDSNPSDRVGQLIGSLDRLPMVRTIGLMPGYSINHLVVSSLSGDDDRDRTIARYCVFDQTLAQP